MSEPNRKILVTSALPYANGPIHLGHLVEYVQTDIWVRFHKLKGRECYYVCADDTHGTPIMLRAEKEGLSPEALIRRMHDEHRRDFEAFRIGFDNYYSTHSDENRELAGLIYERLKAGGHITRRVIKQSFDPVKNMFLPDRFIRGTCPRCGAPDQYGDSCEVCGATYAPTELKNPVSALSGATPVEKDSEHYFFKLGDFEDALRAWLFPDITQPRHVQPEVANKLDEWFAAGLKDWDISRDAPYFGFEIPDAPGKYFYVWLDAPIGYMASFKNLCARLGLDFDAWWGQGAKTELYHFIGKDILYFHALFWPAMLAGAGFRKPTAIYAHGFLTVDGQKMSKSRGTFINARTWLNHLNPEYLRYYFAAKLGPRVEDIDLNMDDFVARINSDLVGKYVNIASRTASFVTRRLNGKLSKANQLRYKWDAGQGEILSTFQNAANTIAEFYEGREFAKATKEIMRLADLANEYIDKERPWEIAKDAGREEYLRDVCSVGLNMFRLLTLYLKPILPALSEQAELFLNIRPLTWNDAGSLIADHPIHPYQHLATRVDPKHVAAMLDESKESLNLPSPSGRGAGGEGKPARKILPPKKLIEFARRLRSEQTDAERLLWELLRDRRVHDAQFRRQHPIEADGKRYILDFYCHDARLGVELDGGQHQEHAAQDAARARVLTQQGITVLRFWNNDVLTETEAVLESIWNALEERLPMTEPSPPAPLPEGEGSSTITIDDFAKVDLRIARIEKAGYVEGADKLLQLTVDIGEGRTRNIFAGIRSAYDPKDLEGRLTVVVANLAPRKMKFGVSEGMVLAAGPGGKELWILAPDSGAQPGMRVK
ncbi:MAG TPA: methionine--tRNA ligase [Acidiferrobacterales bacterium]